jgi:hypothetical protein
VKNRRRITGEDLLVTEALVAESYGRLKRSVARAPSRALRSAGKAVLRHPFMAAAAGALAGILAFGLFGLMRPRGGGRDPRGGPDDAGKKAAESRPDLGMEILSAVLPLAAPYVADLIRSSLDRVLAGEPGTRDPPGR